jgi:sugar O-acyltransferase (sialic acid O-acetyltransferase NeuD family)
LTGAIILGSGGHAGVLIDLLRTRGELLLGVTDPVRKDGLWGVKILGTDDIVDELDQSSVYLINGLGNRASRNDPGLEPRTALFKRFADRNYVFPVVRHPSAIIAHSADLGRGVQVLAGAVIQNSARVLENCIINTRAVVEHDCRIGPHCHIAPGTVICGGAKIGAGSHIGAGAVVLGGVCIGKGSVVAAGAVVTRTIIDGGFADRRKAA